MNNSESGILNTCPICFEGIYFPMEIQCGHIFHTHCIYKWCNTDNYTCPCCRRELLMNGIGMIKNIKST